MQPLIWLQVFLFAALLSHAFLNDFLPKRSQAVGLDRHSLSSNVIHGNHYRRMVAARSIPDLNKRTSNLDRHGLFKKHLVLRFVHDDPRKSQTQRRSFQAEAPFSADVQMVANLPTLLLEDIHEHLEEVRCHYSTIELDFKEQSVASAVRQQAQYLSKVMVISSHLGCNPEGERQPHLVHGMDMTGSSLNLRISPTSWEESFHHVRVHFRKADEDFEIEPFSPIKRRQAAASTPTSAAASTSILFPTAPTTTPPNTEVHQASIDHSWIDTAIVPPSFPGVDSSSLNAANIPIGLTMKCKKCSLEGTVDLTSANFSTGNSNDTTEISYLIEDGTLELAMNDFAAHMEFESTLEASASTDIYTAPFPDIPLTEFVIPGIATVGPVLRPALSIGVQGSTNLDFSYGFDLTLPGTASITLDTRHPNNSRVVGFQNPQLSALPFQAQIDNLNLTVSVGFSPQLLLTANVLKKSGEISAGAFLDLPKLTATFAQVDHVDDKCNPTNDTDTYKDFISNSLTNIVPSVDLGVGVLAGVKLDVGPIDLIDENAIKTIFSTGYPLPTACLSFDKAKKTYGAAAAAAATATGKTGSKSDAAGLRHDGRLCGTSFMLVAVGWIMFSFF